MNRSILIIDDEQTIREALSLFLAGEGYICQVAKDGEQAIQKIGEQQFDIILLDLHMPRHNSLNILEYIKRHRSSSIVIILSEYFHIDNASTALQQGASAVILKPIDFEELLEVIDRQTSVDNAN
ncbi:response regulator [Halalkalibaculum sp. DA3122]|uniref:response regulator n=1 Tax=unclassified Halalkalibaculum TaxID=2964617 RepID=UPI0037553B31